MYQGLVKIISGGQTGADTGGLMAATALHLKTGGTMPKGFRRLTGDAPEFKKFGIKETFSRSYVPRTKMNVNDSDGTVRFASNFRSAGEICTMKAIMACGKPYFDIDVKNPPNKEEFRKWLSENNIRTLNVAGNSEKTSPGIGNFTVKYLMEALTNSFLTQEAPHLKAFSLFDE